MPEEAPGVRDASGFGDGAMLELQMVELSLSRYRANPHQGPCGSLIIRSKGSGSLPPNLNADHMSQVTLFLVRASPRE